MRLHTQSGHKHEITTLVFKHAVSASTRVGIGYGALSGLANVLQQVDCGKKVLILHPPALESVASGAEEMLAGAEFSVRRHVLADGEEGKSQDQLLALWQLLQKNQFTRKDTIVAIGGGAVSDIAGFAASTYLRGLSLVLVPTTLLAQVDAAIGGKTGINLPGGKNLAGSFYFPAAVLVDVNLLSSLPERQIRSGLGEIIKYALIEKTVAEKAGFRLGPRPFLTIIKEYLFASQSKFDLEDPAVGGIIANCIKMKLAVVGKDPYEGQFRRILNLGHTVGHALEKVSDYQIAHGEAVSIGLMCAARLAVRQKRMEQSDYDEIEKTLQMAKLPTSVPANLDRDRLLAACGFDKKREGDDLLFVLPLSPLGSVELDVKVALPQVAELLA